MKKSLIRLVIDTATQYLFVAIYNDLNCLGKYYGEGSNDHSVKLMIEIERIFKENNLLVSNVDEIILGVGPGSYTGLRVGVVVAKIFGWNDDIIVKTISSLALLSSSSVSKDLLISMIDARRGNAFIGVYKNIDNALIMLKEDQLINVDEFINQIEDKYVIINSGEPNLEKILNSNLLTKVEDIHSLSPNYLRLTEAERNLE